jgi:hypothetical protein
VDNRAGRLFIVGQLFDLITITPRFSPEGADMTFPPNVDPMVFKFQYPSLYSTKLSSVFSITVLMFAITFTIRHLSSSSSTYSYDELQIHEASNTTYVLFMLPPPNYTNVFAIVLLNLSADGAEPFSIDAELSCQWYVRPKQSVVSVQLFGHPGINRIFSTGLFSYDAVLSQIHISGDISSIKSVQVLYILGTPEFCERSIFTRLVLSVSSAILFILYLFALISFSRGRLQLEQVLSLVSVLIAAFANLPLEFTNSYFGNLVVHYVSSFMQGLFSSYNTVALFLFAFSANGGDILGFSFLMSLLFILGHTLQTATSDTRVLKLFFDGNMDIWMFFVSISLMGRIALFCLQVYQVISASQCQKSSRRTLIKGYSMMIGIQIATSVLQASVYYVKGYGNFAIDFFGDYLLQTMLAFMFVDVHWPQIPSGRKLSLREQLVALEDLHFPAVDDGSVGPEF